MDQVALWQRSRPFVIERVDLLERAATAEVAGMLDTALRRDAEREAHRLAGLLGMVGSPAGSRLARDLWERFRLSRADDRSTARAALEQVAELRRELEGFTPAPGPGPGRSSEPNDPAPRRADRILIADDDDAVAMVLEMALRRDGHGLARARTGREAVQVASTSSLDLVLLDLEMPELDGFSVCRTLRAAERTRDLPIIVLTAHRDEARLLAALAEGANDYMVKPFAVAQVRARVRMWLMRAAATQ